MFLKLRYGETFNTTIPAANATASFAYYGNSLYDPRVAIGGHQPYSLDTWTQFYKRYRVFGSKIKVVASHNRTLNESAFNNANGLTLYVVPVTDSTVVQEDALMEMPRVRYRTNWGLYPAKPARVSHYATTRQIWGVSKSTASTNAEFSADMSANPASPWYWWIVASRPDIDFGGLYNQNVYIHVRITYYAVLYDRKWLELS